MKISVHKFGGSVLSDKRGFLNMYESINITNHKKVVIISAIGFTSSKLKQSILNAESGDINTALDIFDNIINEHLDLAISILQTGNFDYFKNQINDVILNCKKILNSVSITQELTPKILDRFVAYGEDLALQLIKSYFKDDDTSLILDARQIIITDSNFTNANPNYELTENNIKHYIIPNLDKYDNIIVQGFVSSDEFGNTTTMGFESSNLTATIIAKYLDISQLTIWTNVDGIFDSDPMLNKNAKLIQNLNYDNASYASLAGLKLIYPKMIEIAKEKAISLFFRNGIDLSDRYTLISYQNDDTPSLVIIKHIKFSNKSTNKYFEIRELQYPYSLEISKSKSEEYQYFQLIIINPNKSDIINKLVNNYQSSLDNSEIIIYSGINQNYLSIFVIKELEITVLINAILDLC